ncbi:hypothetical protein N4T20_20255 [Flavobacterium sp. TR2]|uniref:hypothetical protein n=1 Tax=Flavobacterium sp. TR2 TaxID=2977321 RepID=UPI0021B0BBF9|nr:hypothetical protein [Flavobacterium sp. TR2]UWY28040.1 hypothetical protein N4T20_20255 [Flavobacterium sp. TR2]
MTELSHLIENEIISPPNINVIGELNKETVDTALALLRENKTNGRKLIMKIHKE